MVDDPGSRRVLLHLTGGRRVPVEPDEVFFLEAAGIRARLWEVGESLLEGGDPTS